MDPNQGQQQPADQPTGTPITPEPTPAEPTQPEPSAPFGTPGPSPEEPVQPSQTPPIPDQGTGELPQQPEGGNVGDQGGGAPVV